MVGISGWFSDRNVALNKTHRSNSRWTAPAMPADATTLNTAYLANVREDRVKPAPPPVLAPVADTVDVEAVHRKLWNLQNQIRDALLRPDLSQDRRAKLVERAIEVAQLLQRLEQQSA